MLLSSFMKKILYIWILLLMPFCTVFAGDIVTVDTKQLPAAAQKLITLYFPGSRISHIKVEDSFMRPKKYEVLLTDRTEIEFNGDGEWMEIDCYQMPVPKDLIPAYILDWVAQNYTNVSIVKIERDKKEVEVDLDNGFSLTFNHKGELIDFDD